MGESCRAGRLGRASNRFTWLTMSSLTPCPVQDATLTHYSSYTEEEILPVAQLMLNYTLDRNFPSNDSFYRKYSSRKYMKAAVFVRDWAVRIWPRQAAGVKKCGHELYEIMIERERNAKLLETEGGDF